MAVKNDGSQERVPGLVPAGKLAPEDRERVQLYLNLSSNRSLLLGAIIGSPDWDVRPVTVEHGVATICRFTDPKLFSAADRYLAFLRMAKQLEKVQRLIAFHSVGETPVGQFWIKRRFFRAVGFPGPVYSLSKQSRRQLLLQLAKQVRSMHAAGFLHGHISPSNIGISQGRLFLLDPLFCVASTDVDQKLQFVAPEIIRGTGLSPAADVFGIGTLVDELLPQLLNTEETLAAMLRVNPLNRPGLDDVVRVLTIENSAKRCSAGQVQKPQVPVSWSQELKHLCKVCGRAVSSLNRIARSAGYRKLLVITSLSAAVYMVATTPLDSGLVEALRGYATAAERIFAADDREGEFTELWHSGEQEKMQRVAYAAVIENRVDAQKIIVNAAMKQGSIHSYVQYSLLRSAFDPAWQHKLGTRDRKVVMSIALVRLLPHEKLQISALRWVHPGVVYALAAHLPLSVGSEQFAAVSLDRMQTLPGRWGHSFGRLHRAGVGSMAERPARALSHILGGDISDQAIRDFFEISDSADTAAMKLSLVLALAKDRQGIYQLLQQVALTELPAGAALRTWLKDEQDGIWDQLRVQDLVHIAAGDVPSQLSTFQQADLVRFPVAATRTAAAQNLIEKEQFTAEAKVVQFLATEQSRLTREQTRELIVALGDEIDDFPSMRQWLKSAPDEETLLRLLTMRTDHEGIDPFNVAIARHIAQSEFRPALDLLKQLSRHSEPMVRALVYSRLDAGNREERALLSSMVQAETNLRLKMQLNERLLQH